MPTRVDQTALKFNQSMIIAALLLAFLLDWAWLVAINHGLATAPRLREQLSAVASYGLPTATS